MFTANISLKIHPYDAVQSLQLISIIGELDKMGFQEIKEKVEQCVHSTEAKKIVFDCKALEFINSESIGFLMALHAHHAKKTGTITILEANPHIRDVFKTIGLWEIFSHADSLEECYKK